MAAIVVFAGLVLWLRYDALPHVDRYRADIVASIEKSSGMAVSVRAIRGGWGGLRPVLSLEGLAIADRGGKAAFQLARAEVTLSWWSLLRGRVRFHDVDFYRPDLVLRRGADGLIYLADKPLNASKGVEDDGAFTEWLLAQPRLGIHDATLTWRDDFLGAPEVKLSSVEIAVERRRGRHRAALTASPPGELSGRIDARADVALVRRDGLLRARGEAFAEALNADIGRLRAHLPVPETLRNGVGSVRVWARFGYEGVDELVADLNVRDARAQLADDALPLELASLSGRATYRAGAQGFTFATEGLRFRLANGVEAQPGRFSLARIAEPRRTPRVEVKADGIDLKIAATLLDYFPVPREVKDVVLRSAPRGRLADAMVSWSDDGAKTYAVRGRFEDLAMNAFERMPGLEGFSGSIEGTEAGGTVQLAARQAKLDLPAVFREPIAFDRLDAQAKWRRDGAALEVGIDTASFANADAEGEISGTWRSLPEAKEPSPGHAELKGSFTRADATKVARYLPLRLERTADWLQRALLAGSSPRMSFELRGDLYEFPFGGESKGRFVVDADVRGGRLKYHPDWPSVDAIDGTVRLENRRLEVRAANALIFASRVKATSAVIGDLLARPPLLVVEGEVDTTGADTVRFLRDSPLIKGPGAFTRAVSVEGPARLKLRLDFPLFGTEPARVAGDYAFAGATAAAGRSLVLRDLKGRLAFTERGLRAPELTGTLFGHPAALAMGTQADGTLLTTIEGRIETPALAPYVPEAILARLTGGFDWKARVVSGPQGTDVQVASPLAGLAAALPEPFAKRAEDTRALAIEVARLGSDQEVASATLEGGAHGRFKRVADARGGERWQVALKMGAPVAEEPFRDGLWLYGRAPSIDVDAWLAVFDRGAGAATAPAPAAEGPPPAERTPLELRGIDLAAARARYSSREFRDVHAALERRGPQWSGRLEGPLVAGEVRWNPEGRGRVFGKLDRLSIPETTPVAGQPGAASQSDLPAIEVTAERFEFRGRALGRLDLKAEPEGDEWRIERLDIAAPHSTFTSSGSWRRTGAGSITTLAAKLDAGNLSGLFATFGFGDYVKRGTGRLEGTLAWPGAPNDFAVANLSGTIRVEARGGQFAKIEPGAGKLLGLLSLQSLPRRALLDFRDVFSEGFAFERIQGDVKVARGVLLTDDFEISGPSAFVSLAGEVSLPQESQSLTMRVVPEVGEGMALAAGVIGTPVLGLSALLVSKLLRNPLGKVVAYEYLVTGSWDNPVITRTSAAAGARTAAGAGDAPTSAAK